MYFYDGFVYGKDSGSAVRIKSVKVLPDRMLLLTFDTNEQRLFDATILDGEAFLPLKDDSVFNSIKIDHGVVTWKNGDIDCAPEYMYQHSFEYVPKEIA